MYTYVCMYVCIYIHVSIYIYIYIHLSMCIYIYIYTYFANTCISRVSVGAATVIRDAVFCNSDTHAMQSWVSLMAILQGEIRVSTNLRNSLQNFHNNCADKYQDPGLRNSPVGTFEIHSMSKTIYLLLCPRLRCPHLSPVECH